MFQFMVENEMEQKRYSGLKDRILEIEPGLEKQKYIKIHE